MDFNETAKSIGFRDGDILVSADGVPFERYDGDMLTSIVDARQVSVLRNGEAFRLHPEDMMEPLAGRQRAFRHFRFPYVVDSLIVGHPAASAGLQVGDSITHLDGKSDSLLRLQRRDAEAQKAANASHEVTLTYVRNGVTDTLSMMTNADYQIGVAARTLQPTSCCPLSVRNTASSLYPCRNIPGSKHAERLRQPDEVSFLQRRSLKQLGGFGTIGSIFPATWDWHQFWYMTAFLSIILAFMNILPIPALDGGHVLFLIYEIIARRKPSDKFMERAQMVGMFLLFGLLIWANFNDILRYFF